MTNDEFRRWGHTLIDWIADYHRDVEHYPVMSQVKPGEIRAQLPAAPPVHGEPFEAILRDVEQIILPGITHWQSPNFFAFFPSNNSGPVDPRRPALRRPGRAGHALGHQPGVHRTGNPRARLARRSDGPAAGLQVDVDRRRRDPGQRLVGHALCHPCRPRACHRRPRQHGRRRRLAGRLHLDASTFVGRKGHPHRRAWAATTSG